MTNERGVSLSGLLIGVVLLFVIALLAMKVVPVWIEFGKISKAVSSVAKKIDPSQGTVQQVQAAFLKQAELDQITAISHEDLEVTKEGAELVISFSYTSKVPLVANISLLFDFEGSSKGKAGSE